MLSILQSDTKPSISAKENIGILIIFALWPLIGLIIALRFYSNRYSRYVIYLFYIIFGLTIVATEVGSDLTRYASNLKDAAELPFTAFYDILFNLYGNDTSVDFLYPLINFTISRITSSEGILFAVFTGIFGYFSLGSINLLYNQYKSNRNVNTWLPFVFFILIIPVTAIGNFRYSVATWIFFYGAFNILYFGNRNFIWFCVSSIFLHFSFIGANILLLIYLILGNKNWFYYILLVSSFIIPNYLKSIIPQLGIILGAGIQHKADSYLSEASLENLSDYSNSAHWFMIWNYKLVIFYIYIVLILTRTKWRSLSKEINIENLFSFSILILCAANFAKDIPSLGGRIQQLFSLFAMSYIFFIFLKLKGKRINIISILGILLYSTYFALAIRLALTVINVTLLLPTPFFFILEPQSLYSVFY